MHRSRLLDINLVPFVNITRSGHDIINIFHCLSSHLLFLNSRCSIFQPCLSYLIYQCTSLYKKLDVLDQVLFHKLLKNEGD